MGEWQRWQPHHFHYHDHQKICKYQQLLFICLSDFYIPLFTKPSLLIFSIKLELRLTRPQQNNTILFISPILKFIMKWQLYTFIFIHRFFFLPIFLYCYLSPHYPKKKDADHIKTQNLNSAEQLFYISLFLPLPFAFLLHFSSTH